MASALASSLHTTDGQTAFDGGVNGSKSPTIQSAIAPHGLRRDQIAWGGNLTVRGGGATCRTGWVRRVTGAPWTGIWQGGHVYEPDTGDPYLLWEIGGKTYTIRVDTDYAISDVSAGVASAQPYHWYCQAEKYLIRQNGVNPAMVWNGTTFVAATTYQTTTPFLPVGGAMDYYMGRLWVAVGRSFYASDIVRGPTGSAAENYRDAIFHFTENQLMGQGGSFTVPTNAGGIRALCHNAQLDTASGQGQMYVATRKAVYAVEVPVSRADWASSKEPLQRVIQLNYGPVGDRCVVPVNGDLFYASMEPGVRSLFTAVRNFAQWANRQVSRNVNRLLQFNNRALLRYSSGILFGNRLYMTALPEQADAGVVHSALAVLDFDSIGALEDQFSTTQATPVWEGHHEGLRILQLFEADFGGRQRAFAAVLATTGEIELWELTDDQRRDYDDRRITWFLESPAFDFGDPFTLKKLKAMELWVDKLYGEVLFHVDWRVDQNPCWYRWISWKDCAARDCTEDPDAVSCTYPADNPWREQYRHFSLPDPPRQCDPTVARPVTTGHQFQIRITVHGWCRVRGYLLYVEPTAEGLTPNVCPLAATTL